MTEDGSAAYQFKAPIMTSISASLSESYLETEFMGGNACQNDQLFHCEILQL